MGATKTLKLTDHIIEEVLQHIYENSLLQVVRFDFWAVGIADDEEEAEKWTERNASDKPRYFKAFDCKSVENAGTVVDYMKEIGTPAAEPAYEGEATRNRFVYVYKTVI